jgi:hypothetical protein
MNSLKHAGVLFTLFLILAVAIVLASFCTAPERTGPPADLTITGKQEGVNLRLMPKPARGALTTAPILFESRGE